MSRASARGGDATFPRASGSESSTRFAPDQTADHDDRLGSTDSTRDEQRGVAGFTDYANRSDPSTFSHSAPNKTLPKTVSVDYANRSGPSTSSCPDAGVQAAAVVDSTIRAACSPAPKKTLLTTASVDYSSRSGPFVPVPITPPTSSTHPIAASTPYDPRVDASQRQSKRDV